jgi:integrase
MIKARLRYLVSDPDRYGNERYYVRLPGKPKIRIRERFEDQNGAITPEFMAAYWEALNSPDAGPVKVPRSDTFAWLVNEFYKSDAFKGLGKSTQSVRRGILERFCQTAGELPYKKFRKADVTKSRDKRRATPGAADNLVKALRKLFNWAMENELAFFNPTMGVKQIRKSDGWHTWTPEEIDQYRAHFPIGSKPRLAMELLLAIGARRSDAVRLGRQHESGGWLRFTAHKNRENKPVIIEVPILRELRNALDKTETGDLTYIVGERGKPYTIESFGNLFREWCNEAGLPHCSAHGLRKAAAVILAENGATAPELCAIFGWTKLETAEIYIRKAQKRKMAGNAFARLDDYRARESVSLSKASSTRETKRGKNSGKSTPK